MREQHLTAEQETELAARWARDGDQSALDELCSRNIGLAVSIARRFRRRSIETQDLVQVAKVGLVVAAQSFDPARGRFTTHATKVIKRALAEAVSRQGLRSGVTIGTDAHRRLATMGIGRVTQELQAEGSDVTAEAVADRLDVSDEVATALLAAAAATVQLDIAASEYLQLVDDGTPDALTQIIDSETAAELRTALQHLSVTDQRIVASLYIDDESPLRVARRHRMTRPKLLARASAALATLRSRITDRE